MRPNRSNFQTVVLVLHTVLLHFFVKNFVKATHTATADTRKLFQNLRIFLQKFREIDGLYIIRVKIVIFALFWVKISQKPPKTASCGSLIWKYESRRVIWNRYQTQPTPAWKDLIFLWIQIQTIFAVKKHPSECSNWVQPKIFDQILKI